MLIVETIAKIRRAYFVEGKSIKAICRGLRVSRKVVRKVIRPGETAFSYERSTLSGPNSISVSKCVLSDASPPVRSKPMGNPPWSVFKWILAPNPPRDRPRA
jgi:hypothetical protein